MSWSQFQARTMAFKDCHFSVRGDMPKFGIHPFINIASRLKDVFLIEFHFFPFTIIDRRIEEINLIFEGLTYYALIVYYWQRSFYLFQCSY